MLLGAVSDPALHLTHSSHPLRFLSPQFDYVFDKSLIDTMMCYEDGVETTEKLFLEMHRVLKPGGRLLQVSLHKEDEVDVFAASPGCSFIVTTCKLKNMKLYDDTPKQDLQNMALFHTFACFDKLDGLSEKDRDWVFSQVRRVCVVRGRVIF